MAVKYLSGNRLWGTNAERLALSTLASADWTIYDNAKIGISDDRLNIDAVMDGSQDNMYHTLDSTASDDWVLRWKQRWTTITQQGGYDNTIKMGLASSGTTGGNSDEPNRVSVMLQIEGTTGKRTWYLQKVGGGGQDSHNYNGEDVFVVDTDYYLELIKNGTDATFSIKIDGYGVAGTEIADGGFSIVDVSVSGQNTIFIDNRDIDGGSGQSVNISYISEMFWYDNWDGTGSVPTPTTTFDFTDVYPSLPNGTIFITSDTNVHYMWNGTDTWNEVA